METWAEGKVIQNKYWTDQLYSLQIEADTEPFIAGQFSRLAMDIEGEQVARPYSIVNAPGEAFLEYYSIIVPSGPLSPHLFALKPGDSIWVSRKANGFFTLNEVPDSDNLWLLSTGTGIGPFLSILKTEEPWKRFKKIILAHGVRKQEELSYQQTIDSFKTTYNDQFCMVPFISRETTNFAIQEHIPQAIENGNLETKTGIKIKPDNSQIMLCGNPDMVRETTEVLEKRGLTKNLRRKPGQITTEKYW